MQLQSPNHQVHWLTIFEKRQRMVPGSVQPPGHEDRSLHAHSAQRRVFLANLWVVPWHSRQLRCHQMGTRHESRLSNWQGGGSFPPMDWPGARLQLDDGCSIRDDCKSGSSTRSDICITNLTPRDRNVYSANTSTASSPSASS
jgi:hypothetical protein